MDSDAYIKALLGENIKLLRERKGMTQERLAAEVSLSPKSITNIENGTTFPRAGTIHSLSQALKVTPAELFLTEAERASDKNAGRIGYIAYHDEVDKIQSAINRIFDDIK